MALAVDASSPALVTGNSVTSLTTAAFNPPATSLLVAVCLFKTTGAGVTPLMTMSNNGAALDTAWALAKKMDQSTGATDCAVHIVTGKIVSSRSGMTITVTPSGDGQDFDEIGALKVYVITGHATPTSIGASGSGESTTNNLTAAIYTSTANNSLGIGGATNATDLGTPTSTDTASAFAVTFAVEGLAVVKAATTPTSGTGVTMNFDATGASAAAWNWAAIEILAVAAAGGTATYGVVEDLQQRITYGFAA